MRGIVDYKWRTGKDLDLRGFTLTFARAEKNHENHSRPNFELNTSQIHNRPVLILQVLVITEFVDIRTKARCSIMGSETESVPLEL